MPNAETLLLVKDKQAKIRENHIVRKEPMRTDEDVDLSTSFCLAEETKRLSSPTLSAKPESRERKVW